MTEFQRIADAIEEGFFHGRLCPEIAPARYRRVRGIERLVGEGQIIRSIGLLMALSEEQHAQVEPLRGPQGIPFMDFMIPPVGWVAQLGDAS